MPKSQLRRIYEKRSYIDEFCHENTKHTSEKARHTQAHKRELFELEALCFKITVAAARKTRRQKKVTEQTKHTDQGRSHDVAGIGWQPIQW